MKETKRQCRGQAFTEFALLLPLLVLILGAILDFGLAMHTYMNLTKIAQDAAMSGARNNSSDDDVRSLVSALSQDYGFSTDQVAAQLTRPQIEGTAAIRVELSFDYRPISPGVVTATKGAMTLIELNGVPRLLGLSY